MHYAWDDSFVYEIHTSPYRITDFMLEPGEQVLEMPFLSEEKVWEIGAGVSLEKGQDVQHFFLKPAYSGLTTSMIIITDRRVYHLLLKSFKNSSAGGPERHMVMVRFNYPPPMPFAIKSDKLQKRSDEINSLAFGTALVDPRLLSFDYKMSYSASRKPSWLPQRVYDDGRKTYIVMDRRMLHAESPVLFNRKNERINYRVHENMIVIDGLVEKVTLRVGKDKVTVVKKKFKIQAGGNNEPV
jgi:type IV secretion system protein VirB9